MRINKLKQLWVSVGEIDRNGVYQSVRQEPYDGGWDIKSTKKDVYTITNKKQITFPEHVNSLYAIVTDFQVCELVQPFEDAPVLFQGRLTHCLALTAGITMVFAPGHLGVTETL